MNNNLANPNPSPQAPIISVNVTPKPLKASFFILLTIILICALFSTITTLIYLINPNMGTGIGFAVWLICGVLPTFAIAAPYCFTLLHNQHNLSATDASSIIPVCKTITLATAIMIALGICTIFIPFIVFFIILNFTPVVVAGVAISAIIHAKTNNYQLSPNSNLTPWRIVSIGETIIGGIALLILWGMWISAPDALFLGTLLIIGTLFFILPFLLGHRSRR